MAKYKATQIQKPSDQIAFNSEEHTKDYLKYHDILVWKTYGGNGDRQFTSTLRIDPADHATIYRLTLYMTDRELDNINIERTSGCGCGHDCRLWPLPRLAKVGLDKYVVVANQHERHKAEDLEREMQQANIDQIIGQNLLRRV
jgi:hypothetical protein